jgi:hypothetical protein
MIWRFLTGVAWTSVCIACHAILEKVANCLDKNAKKLWIT